MSHGWFEFQAFNAATLYGYGTAPDARRYCHILNTGREVDLYTELPLPDFDAERLGLNAEDLDINLARAISD